MKVAHFHFDNELIALLAEQRRKQALEYGFTGPQSAKHLIESLGIPHTEIGTLHVNGEFVDTDYQVRDRDEVTVRASSQAADAPGALDRPLANARLGLRLSE
jgi:hypothetical protein